MSVDRTLEDFAFDAAIRALDKQEGVLDELRSRTGLLLAASSLAISFLGRPAFEGAHAVPLVLAIAAFVISIAAAVYVLLPKSSFYFALSGRGVFEGLYEFRDDPSEIQRRLVYDMQRFWEGNDAVMQRLFRGFRLAAATLVLEIGLLLISVSDTLIWE